MADITPGQVFLKLIDIWMAYIKVCKKARWEASSRMSSTCKGKRLQSMRRNARR